MAQKLALDKLGELLMAPGVEGLELQLGREVEEETTGCRERPRARGAKKQRAK